MTKYCFSAPISGFKTIELEAATPEEALALVRRSKPKDWQQRGPLGLREPDSYFHDEEGSAFRARSEHTTEVVALPVKKFNVLVSLDGDAFEKEPRTELARILHALADRVVAQPNYNGTCVDSNNRVCAWFSFTDNTDEE